MPEIKAVILTKRSGPLSYQPRRLDGIRTRVSLLAGEVRIACAPGTPDAVPPEIKDGAAGLFQRSRRTLRTGRCMKLCGHCSPYG